ncbi:MAG: adenylate/guanylate cyclase domain-containing protein [Alphaproteobacteria bacterium]|nr:adenylate/guanylate cyclase domain-containing protein [Alphaproteobacteria bacterium]
MSEAETLRPTAQRASPDTPGAIPSWARGEVAAWLADHRGTDLPGEAVVGELCDRLVAAGVPLARCIVALDDVHPQVGARGFFWRRGARAELELLPLTSRLSPDYQHSPILVIHNGASAIRRRLTDGGVALDFPVLHELRAAGFTDYMAMPLIFSDGQRHFISWTTDAPGGFTVDTLTLLYDLMPLICLRLEIAHGRIKTRTLLETYLGQLAATRILAGRVRRSEGETLRAVLMFADMRGFTLDSGRLTPDDLIRLLNIFYDTIADPILRHGGDVVKLIGDGVLTIFPVEDEADAATLGAIVRHAARAAQEAEARLRAFTAEDLPGPIERLRGGFGLELGSVSFGNVGSASRLDFTVIGPSVNEVVRLESMTKILGVPILASDRFCLAAPELRARSLGFHALRGVPDLRELHSLPILSDPVAAPGA